MRTTRHPAWICRTLLPVGSCVCGCMFFVFVSSCSFHVVDGTTVVAAPGSLVPCSGRYQMCAHFLFVAHRRRRRRRVCRRIEHAFLFCVLLPSFFSLLFLQRFCFFCVFLGGVLQAVHSEWRPAYIYLPYARRTSSLMRALAHTFMKVVRFFAFVTQPPRFSYPSYHARCCRVALDHDVPYKYTSVGFPLFLIASSPQFCSVNM